MSRACRTVRVFGPLLPLVPLLLVTLAACDYTGTEHVECQRFEIATAISAIEHRAGQLTVNRGVGPQTEVELAIRYRGRQRPRAVVRVEDERLLLDLECPPALLSCDGEFRVSWIMPVVTDG